MPKTNNGDPGESIEDFILLRFEENFERLKFENGHGLAPEAKEAAKRQVLLYWRRLREVAETVTDTEVRLNLPGRQTPKGRKFCIEGIVDIVRDKGRTVMYDLKTHDPEYIEKNLVEYEGQLNVYAHIWKNLRNQELNETAVIATRLPKPLEASWVNRHQNPDAFQCELEKWNPIIPIPFSTQHVENTIQAFASTVDHIEDGIYAPPPASKLSKKEVGDETFATRACGNCDLRFSCRAFREYLKNYRTRDLPKFKDIYEDAGPESERENRIDDGLAGPGPREQ